MSGSMPVATPGMAQRGKPVPAAASAVGSLTTVHASGRSTARRRAEHFSVGKPRRCGAGSTGAGAARPGHRCVLHCARHRDGSSDAYVEDARRARALHIDVPVHTRRLPGAHSFDGAQGHRVEAVERRVLRANVHELRRRRLRLLRVLVLGAVRRVVLALGG